MSGDLDQHPLLTRTPPAWLADVPISVSKPTLVDVGGGKSVPADMLAEALDLEIGPILTSFSAPAQLASRIAEFTEKSDWSNLPSEPTSIERLDADRWSIRVGSFEAQMSRSEIEGLAPPGSAPSP